MHRRTLVAATGTVLSAGCLTVFEEGQETIETTHIDERVTESESFFFEVAEGAEAEIIVRLEESGSATVDLSRR
ncbi:hypothetical protein [Halovenus sp. HT40]|uniref:hypothetical protein n=1 Tax=Halovenus sp. HT40 TaxID=3126691 RepID=UPI00300F76DB